MSELVGFIKVEFFSDGSNKISHDLGEIPTADDLSISLSSCGINFSVSPAKKGHRYSKKKKSDEDLKARIMHIIADTDKPISVIYQRAISKQYSKDEVLEMIPIMESEGLIKKVQIEHIKRGQLTRYAKNIGA